MRLQLASSVAVALVAASFVMASLHVAKTQDKVERPLKVRDDLPVAANGMQILTGATIVGHGFNAKTGQQGLFPILDWTYQFNNTWMSPVTGVTYAVPDQINVASVPESSTRIVESMSFNFSTMFNEYTSWFKFGIGISEPGVFSLGVNYNRELARTKMEVNLEDRMQGFSQYWCTYYGLDMAPAYVLNPSDFFKLAISKLPATISTQADRTMYEEFVQSYGTHYVCYGAFGGSVHLDTYLDKSLTNTYTMEQIAHQLSLSFSFYLFNINGGGFHNKTDIKFATWFAQNAHTYMFWVGGAPAYQTNQSVGEWLQSIPDYAGLLNTTLCPMDVLINWDTARQATFKSFVHDYLQ